MGAFVAGSIGIPRELKTMQAVLAISPPPLSLQAAACWIVVWGFGLPVLTPPIPKDTSIESGSAGLVPAVQACAVSPSVCQHPAPPLPVLFQTSRWYVFPARS